MTKIVLLIVQRIQLFLVKFGFVIDAQRGNQLLLVSHFERLQQQGTEVDKLEDVGFNIYSATYEDGILLYIFSIIKTTNRKLVDIGAGTIRGSSVSNLIVNHGFSGVLIDGNKDNCELLTDYYARHPETTLFPPTVACELVTSENVNQLMSSANLSGEIDLLCIDIDGIDYWVWKAISTIQPRVVVVEYQDILGPERSWSVPYKPDFSAGAYPVNRELNNYHGASLRAFTNLAQRKGYYLVGCNRGGWNAFFVRNDLRDKCLREVTIESCFRHPRNEWGMKTRFPLVEGMEWEEV